MSKLECFENSIYMPSHRHLAAILFADIVGFTSVMEEDEDLALKLRDKLKNKIESEMTAVNGKLLKISGDGVLCSFDSAIDAIKTACSVQLDMQREPKVPLRIGIHQSDVVFEEFDVHGDAVNIASRLESLAVPGSVLISGKLRDDIKNHKDIQTFPLGKYVLKNVKEPVEIFAISNPGLIVPRHIRLEGKGTKYRGRISKKALFQKVAITACTIILLFLISYFFVLPWVRAQDARSRLLPKIQTLVNGSYSNVPVQAFDLSMEASKYIPNDSGLIKMWPAIADTVTIETQPSGAKVFWKDYNSLDSAWRFAGITPLKNAVFPKTFLRFEIRLKGYQTIEYAGPAHWWESLRNDFTHLKLDKINTLPRNMVRIPRRESGWLVGLERCSGKSLDEFLIDRTEVSNIAFKAFIDNGGYTNKAFWSYPIYDGEKFIPFEKALSLFVDRTGRPGPSTWEAGTYPDGQENYPVTGISWYEAAAFASYCHKQLPTIYHWSAVAQTSRADYIIPLSNYTGKSPTPVGNLPDLSAFGIYDLAGNAREWCLNESGISGQRYILGGGWDDPYYSFNDAGTQPAIDRSESNGFRCMMVLSGDTTFEKLKAPATPDFRDYSKEKPVDDKTFKIFLNQYIYDKEPLNAHIDKSYEGEFWTCEKISVDAAYNAERLVVYLYLPKGYKRPYQTVIYFPGSGDLNQTKFDPMKINYLSFILKSGRAVAYPIYKSTWERHDNVISDLPNESVSWKDHVIMWSKDLGRTLDYLETRSEIAPDKFAYFGLSWGGAMASIMPAVEKRIKAVVLYVGGLNMQKALPQVDELNFLPHVNQPILMLEAKYDMFYPVETSQKPYFDLLGTPKENKKMITYPSGHVPPRTQSEKEALDWLDKFLGPVK